MITRSWLLALLLAAGHAAAADYTGRVVGVTDGESLTVLLVRGTAMRIRLADIDAPEPGQDFAERSRQALAELCQHREATFTAVGMDRSGRTLAKVQCGPHDVETEMVGSGMAWVNDAYVTDPSLYTAQKEAKARRLGLWADPHAQAPWDWRRREAARRRAP